MGNTPMRVSFDSPDIPLPRICTPLYKQVCKKISTGIFTAAKTGNKMNVF